MLLFKDIVSRADSSWLLKSVGALTARALMALDGHGVSAGELRRAFFLLCDPAEFLADADRRASLFELLRAEEAKDLALTLGLSVRSDPYGVLNELRLSRGSTRFDTLCSFFGVSPNQETNSVDVVEATTKVAPKYGLFPHQRDAVNRARRYLKTKSKRVLLHMPTGAGKTRVAMHIVCQHLIENTGSVVVWLANSEELCEQAAVEFDKAWSSLGDSSINVTRFWGSYATDLDNVPYGLLVGGFSKLYSRTKNKISELAFLGDKTSLVVIDEAHKVIAPTYELVIEALAARREQMPVLGLTATPGRTWNDPESDRLLADFFNKQKVTLKVSGYDTPVDYLIEEGYLARPTFQQLPHVSARLTAKELQNLAVDLDIPASILIKLASDEGRTVLIVKAIENLLTRHKRVIVFSTTVAHAEMLTAVLSTRGASARCITGETPSGKRSETIDWYKKPVDETRVIVNFGVLTAGFDAPKTSAVLIARPTKSLVLYSQMVGRATRGPAAGGSSHAEIITVVDTALPGFGDLSKAFTNWEDVW